MNPKKFKNTSPRVKVIQKIYGSLMNPDEEITYPKNQYKKYIKDVVNGTIERNEVINDELLYVEKDYNLNQLDKIFTIIIKAAIFEFLYKFKTPIKIIIKEYLEASNYFLNPSQVKYLHSINMNKIY